MPSRRFHRSIALGALALTVGCQLVSTRPAGDDASSRGGVAVLLDGSAFKDAAAREAVVTMIGERAGRPARVLPGEPTANAVLQPIAKRTARERGSYDWREPPCAKRARALLPAIAGGAELVVRVRLDVKTTARPATAADRKALADVGGRALAAVGLGSDDTVVETRIDGSVERTTFAGSPKTTRETVHWTGKRLAAKASVDAGDVRTAAGVALERMGAAPAPHFDALAQSLVTADCPFLAYAVATTLVAEPAQRKLASAATIAMRRTTAPEKPEPVASAADTMPSGPEPDEPMPAETTPTYSCSTLCSLHMVELCNGDRTLWSQHGTRWEASRCGVRRPEAFLAECYRMQWLSGTYEHACVQPCEDGSGGRLRLEAMLRHAGCLRAGS
jgi:hypothetical protein